jgi:hypothetical protein
MKAVIAGLMLGLFSTAATAGPAVSTEWMELRISLENCKSRSESAIRAAGIRDVDVKQWTVFGHQTRYTVAIRCMPDQGVVFFIATGEQLKGADSLLDDVIAEFRRRN